MANPYEETDDCIDTDAQSCPDEDETMSQITFKSEPQLLAWSNLCQLSSNDKTYLPFLYQFPPKLQDDNCEILIINSKHDWIAATQFKHYLENEIVFSIQDQSRTPRVKLLHEMMYQSFNMLNIAFSKALYVFLYVTKHLCEQNTIQLQVEACLAEAIGDSNRNVCVVPVHATLIGEKQYTLKMELNCLPSISYCDDRLEAFDVNFVSRLIESDIGLLLERDMQLDEDRRNYFNEHKQQIYKRLQYMHGSKLLASSSSPVICSKVLEDSIKVSAQDSSNNASSVCHTDVGTHLPLPDQQIKSFQDESLSDVIQGMEEIVVSENNVLPQSNSCERVTQEVLVSHGAERSQYETTAAANNNINRFESIGQSSPAVPISASREPDSSIVVDGPAGDENSLSTNSDFRGYPYRMAPNQTETSTVHAGQCNPNSFDGPVNLPVPIHSNNVHGPNLNQSVQQYPPTRPCNLQQLNSNENHINKNTFFHEAMRSQNKKCEPDYYNHPSSTPSTGPHRQTSTGPQRQPFSTVAQQTHSYNADSDEYKTPHEHQLGTGRTGYKTQHQKYSAGTIPVYATGPANPVIQHIHHHHNETKITVETATNVLIGDKSSILIKGKLPEEADNEDVNFIPNTTSLGESNYKASTSNPDVDEVLALQNGEKEYLATQDNTASKTEELFEGHEADHVVRQSFRCCCLTTCRRRK